MVSIQANSVQNTINKPVILPGPRGLKPSPVSAPKGNPPVQDQAQLLRQGQALNRIELREATLEGVRAGLVLGLGAEGPVVKTLQNLLTQAGYPVQVNGRLGPTTESLLRRFQRDQGIQPTGQLGPTTLKALENPLRETAFGRRLATAGRQAAHQLGGYRSLGKCYTGVARALERHGVSVTGLSAYMAANQLAKHPRFREVSLPAASLSKLPAGAIVVWERSPSPALRHRGGGWTHGHISIADGKGREMSDYIDKQRTSYYVSNRYRVFLPK